MIEKVKKLYSRYEFLEQSLEALKRKIEKEKENLERAEKALALIQEVAKRVQTNLQSLVSSFVTDALDSIFDDPYEFKLEFVERRRQVEANLALVRNDLEVSPLDATGGGVVDIVSFALRLLFWSIGDYRPIMILDEPFKNLSSNLQPLAGEFLRQMVEKLNVQFLINTHIQPLINEADRVFVLGEGNENSLQES